MDYAGTNYLAVLLAAVAAWFFGALWYGILFSKPWIKAARIDLTTSRRSPEPFIVSFIAEVVMAIVLAGAIGHLGGGQVTLTNGVISGLILWAGFIATTLAVNQRYQGFGWGLTVIDAGHWLGVMLLMGAIIGAMGV
ncbi:DUF1761 family protein [Mesorhizobium sp. NBSH29]|uniref:DUF1761 domain-containing protein n=1 Tax=Mesorhizobium sp. NBSH29 TaxID=2654249 RepID=UPI0018964C9C|nr:DUF1761 domain-containing protein [Mesorhizobium sp. NBSH29]QPC85978.1 DUF1761 family protein [Mesorhizobium sp. NBSH29]